MQNPLAGHTNSYHTYGSTRRLQGSPRLVFVTSSFCRSRVDGARRLAFLRPTTPPGRGYGLEAVSLSGTPT